MKTLRITGLLAFVAVIGLSCNLNPGGEVVLLHCDYVLNLSFRDAAGNDLIMGLERDSESGSPKSDSYVFDILVSEPCSDWDNRVYNAPARPGFVPDVNRPVLYAREVDDTGTVYLGSGLAIPVNGCAPQERLTYKLKFPQLFGDNETHEFVTYWDVPKELAKEGNTYMNCVRIEFEGQTIIPTHVANQYNNAGVVVLNN